MTTMLTYLEQMTVRVAQGLAALPEELRARHSAFLKARQQEDGGFAGREGGSDLYYTGFGLRALAVLGELHGEVAERAAQFLRQKLIGQESIIDFLSLIYGATLINMSAGIDIFEKVPHDWRTVIAGELENLRRDDGGYAKGKEGRASSTYHTFLVTLCLELIERPLVDPERLIAFIHSQKAEGGGFLEIRAGKRAGTNPTAAAIGVLKTLNALDENVKRETIDFLADMQTDEGGLRANTRIPISDLLSTFTGCLTLIDLEGGSEIDVEDVLKYVYSLEQPAGGFHGAAWDEAADVEYTFYGLGTLAILNPGAS